MKKRMHYKGQALVEFALIIPIALFLLVGFFDLGRVIFYYASLTNAIREATRTVIVLNIHKDETSVRNAVVDELETYAFGINPAEIFIDNISYFTDADDVRTSTSGSAAGTMTNILINVSYSFKPITPLISRLLNDGMITLRTHSTMRIPSPYRPTFE